jgi:hypothetical protein
MPQTLPEGCFILPADVKRIEAALADLKKTNNAHASLQVQINLHEHYEYPKHIVVHEKTYVVNSPQEEKAALSAPAPKPAKHAAQPDPNPIPFAQTTATPPTNTPNAPVFTKPGPTYSCKASDVTGNVFGVSDAGNLTPGAANPGPRQLVEGQVGAYTGAAETAAHDNLTEMSKADRKQELGGMTKAELRGVADQHDVHTDSSMNKGEITSALNRQLNKEAKTGAE